MELRDFIMGRKNAFRTNNAPPTFVPPRPAIRNTSIRRGPGLPNHPYIVPTFPIKWLRGACRMWPNREDRKLYGGPRSTRHVRHQGLRECARRRAKLPWWVRAESSLILDPLYARQVREATEEFTQNRNPLSAHFPKAR